ncbi:hypothetical protein C8Q75DRAFT_734795 [Abortiporus biennis]|nr:hypothetical protein C8Q75DRAFT_734795 [Abortiporus biennis]
MASYTSSSSKPTHGSQSLNSGPKGGSSTDHKNLLTPVVRSKRTPIACTECRRRQVKCTGATPRCERCEKKGVKCEYIPCSQQKAASAGSQSPQISQHPLHVPSHASPYVSPQQWQQMHHSQPAYVSEPTSYAEQVDWRSSRSSTSSPLLQQQYMTNSQIPPQLYGMSGVGQAAYTSSNGAFIQQPAVGRGGISYPQNQPQQLGYPAGYQTPDLTLQNPSNMAFAYTDIQQPSGHSGEYYSNSGDMFDNHANGLVTDSSDRSWPDSLSYPGY